MTTTCTHNLQLLADLHKQDTRYKEVIFVDLNIISASKRQTQFLMLKMGVGLFNAPKIHFHHANYYTYMFTMPPSMKEALGVSKQGDSIVYKSCDLHHS